MQLLQSKGTGGNSKGGRGHSETGKGNSRKQMGNKSGNERGAPGIDAETMLSEALVDMRINCFSLPQCKKSSKEE